MGLTRSQCAKVSQKRWTSQRFNHALTKRVPRYAVAYDQKIALRPLALFDGRSLSTAYKVCIQHARCVVEVVCDAFSPHQVRIASLQ